MHQWNPVNLSSWNLRHCVSLEDCTVSSTTPPILGISEPPASSVHTGTVKMMFRWTASWRVSNNCAKATPQKRKNKMEPAHQTQFRTSLMPRSWAFTTWVVVYCKSPGDIYFHHATLPVSTCVNSNMKFTKIIYDTFADTWWFWEFFFSLVILTTLTRDCGFCGGPWAANEAGIPRILLPLHTADGWNPANQLQ